MDGLEGAETRVRRKRNRTSLFELGNDNSIWLVANKGYLNVFPPDIGIRNHRPEESLLMGAWLDALCLAPYCAADESAGMRGVACDC